MKILRSQELIIKEAKRRAIVALSSSKDKEVKYAVGFCEGVILVDEKLMTSIWCAVVGGG